MGATGQLRSFRVRRVERDLRAVKERETKEEQLERRREMRWRKGLDESQRVALWKEDGEHGSLEVGMFRDCIALSCFGSSVEGDDREDDEGEDVGEGVGERGTEREMGGKRRRRSRRNGGGGAMAWR